MMLLIKASVLMAAALTGAHWLRRAPAATRHLLWSLAFAALIGLPLLGAVLPSLDVPWPKTWHVPGATDMTPASVTTASAAGNVTVVQETATRLPRRAPAYVAHGSAFDVPAISPALALRSIWLVGALAACGALLVSCCRVRRLARRSRPLDDAGWQQSAQRLARRLGARRPIRLVLAATVRTPMAGGLWHPTIFLPAVAESWSDERRDIVLAHEVAHLASGDPLRLLAARLALACYWFHPLAWLAARESSLAREQACDATVLSLGIRPSVYACTLLELADRMTPSAAPVSALPMIEHSLLEERLMTILTDDSRPVIVRRPLTLAVAALAITLPIAAARPAARDLSVTPPALAATSRTIAARPVSVTKSPFVTPSAGSAAAPQRQAVQGACAVGAGNGDFSGFTSTDKNGVVIDRVGTSDGSRIIVRHFGDLRVCMSSDDVTGADRPSDWVNHAAHVVLATERAGSARRLDIQRQAGTVRQTWWVNDVERPFDGAAQAWRAALLTVMDRTWEMASVRGQESTLRGEISTLRGQESTLRGDISTLRGEVSTMRGRQSTVRGEESTLRGQISDVEGHVSSLRGEIASERGDISSLVSDRWNASDAERARIAKQISDHEAAIDRLERELHGYDANTQVQALERQIAALDANGKVAAIDNEIRAFDETAKTAAIERQIAALDVDGKTAAIEQQIRALDVNRRTTDLERQLDDALARLDQALKAIK